LAVEGHTVVITVVHVQICGDMFVLLHVPVMPFIAGQSLEPPHENMVEHCGMHSRVVALPAVTV
jgi:hypothetical protein